MGWFQRNSRCDRLGIADGNRTNGVLFEPGLTGPPHEQLKLVPVVAQKQAGWNVRTGRHAAGR